MNIISPTGLGIRNDSMGFGYYGAPRGSRMHKGTDFLCIPGQDVVCPIPSGKIIREARPYIYERYSGCLIQGHKIAIKMFYLDIWAHLIGKTIKQGEVIGIAQDISKKYGTDMKPHIHLSIVGLDPQTLMKK